MIIEDHHFEYLKLQRGALSDLAHDRAAWCEAYRNSLVEDYGSIASFIPVAASSVLDIGSGLGGINALIVNQNQDISVCLLDGDDDAPEMHSHSRTFSNKRIAFDFLTKNGVKNLAYRSPETPEWEAKYDLIISLQSWCFHYPPSHYIDLAKRCMSQHSALIVDVRKDKPFWLRDLVRNFEINGVARAAQKYDRLVFRAKA